MSKLLKVAILLGIAALVMLLMVGAAGASHHEPEGTAVRINFEISGQEAKRGLYVVQTPGGGQLTSWYALDGWQDSGWLSNLDVAKDTVWLEVVYYPGPDTVGTTMLILNHVPGETYGWVNRGESHALEVAWPNRELICWVTDGSERTAYFTKMDDGTVYRTMIGNGKQDIYKPYSTYAQPGEEWEIWYFKSKGDCATPTASSYNDYLGTHTPYWHLKG